MEVKEFQIKGPKLITSKVFADNRGFFVERFKEWELKEILPEIKFVQDNFSRSNAKVLRGLHYQFDQPQGKLVTCLQGKIYDVAVDIRKGSPTFGQHIGAELDGDHPQWLWIPAGFAHGFCVVGEKPADVLYKVNAAYNPKGEAGILWSDADLKIAWPVKDALVSPKDEVLPRFQEYSKAAKF
jgi:dTDP-4-dehydrorhamnose 3,5-epimerase